MQRTQRTFWVVIVAAALTSAACGGAAPTPSPTAAPTRATVAAPISAAGAAAPIKIGVIEALTGPLASVGKDNQDGFNLYLESVGGAVAGRKIETIFVDTAGQADVALAKATQLALSDGVHVIAGVIQTPEAYALATWVKQQQIPIAITGNAGAYDVLTNPQFKSPYMVRFTSNSLQMPGPVADWLLKQGRSKAIVFTSDFEGGLQVADTFGRAFVNRGGEIIQEMHPPLGTNDFGPFLTQISQSADTMLVFLQGADGLRFGTQYSDYVRGSTKMVIVDMFGFLTSGANLQQLKDKALAFTGSTFYSEAYQSPENQAFLKAFHDKYPGRTVSTDVANGYTGAQALVAALKKVSGNVEDKQKFLDALYATDIASPRGPIKLDGTHDIIQNLFLYQLKKQGDGYAQDIQQSYTGISANWDMSPDEVVSFPLGRLKGKWVGMTKDLLAKVKKE